MWLILDGLTSINIYPAFPLTSFKTRFSMHRSHDNHFSYVERTRNFNVAILQNPNRV